MYLALALVFGVQACTAGDDLTRALAVVASSTWSFNFGFALRKRLAL